MSLSCVDATGIVDIVSTILLSVIILRVSELMGIGRVHANVQNQFAMEVVSVFLLLPSLLLELISVGFRSMSLGFRIFANVAAGHVLSDIVLVARYLGVGQVAALISHFVFSYLIVAYEIGVACIQLGVFLSLVAVYID